MKEEPRKAVHRATLGRLMLLLAAPVAAGLAIWFLAELAERRAQWIQHGFQVQISLEHLATDIRTAEDSQRGYLLTGESNFLASYRAAQRSAREQVSLLADMTADNPRQTESLRRLDSLLQARFSFQQSLIDDYSKHGLDLASAKAAMDRQVPPTGSIQALLDAMRSEEDKLLGLREADLANTRMRFYWAFGLGYGLIVVIVLSLYLSVRRYSLQSAAAEERLSMLNEQLDQRVRDRTALLNAREELLNTFVQHVPAAVAMLDREMRYLQVSDRWCYDYGLLRAEVLGASHYELFPDLPAGRKEIHRRCLSGETLRSEEDPWVRSDGSVLWLHWEIRPWGSMDGLPEGMLIFSENITERKQAEAALRESEATIRTLLDTASQAILAVDERGAIVIANRMVGEMFGYTPEELVGKPLEVLMPERFRMRHQAHREAFGAKPKNRAMGGLDLVGMRRDGTDFPIEVSLSSVQTKAGLLAVSFVSDITARKKAESDLRENEQKLRSLAASLLTAQEDERRTLARELHDDVTQRLAFLSIELGRLAKDCPDGQGVRCSRLKELQQQALGVSAEVRRLSHGLHPSVISDFGLSVALEEFCDEYEKAGGIHVCFDGPVDDSGLNDIAATCLYRVAQESMRNAMVHGHATDVKVSLRIAANEIQLKVEDNGIGFSTDPFHSRTGIGIASMRERVRLVNGTLSIASASGHGCAVTATVPLRE